jgi:hypothetical protein
VPIRTVVVPVHIVGDEHNEVGRRGRLRLRAAERAGKQHEEEKQKENEFGPE